MNRILITLLLALLIAASAFADSNRVLLRPPDNYDGINIGGVPFVMGQVYLPQYADTALLKPFGFRDFQFVGSTSRYKKIKAWWPLNTDVAELPEAVLGLTYEKMTEEDLAYAAIMRPDLVPPGMNLDELSSVRYAQMYPADGKPHRIYKDQPYVEGILLCSSRPDEDALDSIGIVLFHDFDSYKSTEAAKKGYSRWSAMWPMSLTRTQLPDYVVGIIADSPFGFYDEYDSDYSGMQVFHQRPYTTYNYYNYNHPSYPVRYYRPRPSTNYNYSSTPKVRWTTEQRNNPNAYYYKTQSRTTLQPTTIGAYSGNRSLGKVGRDPYCRYNSRYRYNYCR